MMSDPVSVPVPSSAPAKKIKPKPKVKKAPAAEHPKYSDMIVTAVKALRKPKGASRQAIASYLQANFDIPAGSARVISRNLKSMVTSQKLSLTSGVGAAGRYKVNKAKGSPKKGKRPKVGKKKRGSPKKKRAKAKKRKSPVKKRSAKRSPRKKTVKRKAKKPAKKVAKRKPAKKGKK